jgi:PAS domain S-box-containing protein
MTQTKAMLEKENAALRRRIARLEKQSARSEASAISENERNLQTFFNTIDHLLFVLDAQGNILLINDAVTRKLGYSPDDLRGQSVLCVHPPDRREEAGRIVGEMLAGTADYCPVPLIAKDGRQIPVETRVVQGKWSGQDVIFGVTKDLSDIKASEEKFSKIFQAGPSPMALTDLGTGKYIDVNEAFLKSLGYTREEVVGKTAAELSLFYDPKQRTELLQRMQQQGYLRNENVLVRTHTHQLRRGIFSAEFVQLQDRKILLTVMDDVTERYQAEYALKVSEQRFSSVFHANPAAQLIVLLDSERIIDANEAFFRQTEYSSAEVIGHSTMELGLWANPRQTQEIIERLQSQGHVRNIEIDFKTRSGKIANGLASFQVIELQGVRCIISTVLDITERKQAEMSMRQAQARYYSLFEQSHDAVFILDLQGRHLEVNHRAAEMLGYTPAEMIGLSVAETSADIDQSRNVLACLIAGEHVPLYERRFRKKDGTVIPVEINVELVRDIRGQPLHIQSVVRDISERKQAEAALRASEDKYRLLLETAYEGVWVVDQSGQTTYVNQAMADMLGYLPAEMIGKQPADFISDDDVALYQERMNRRHAGGDQVFEHRFTRRDGSVLWAQISARVIKDNHGNFNGSIAMFTDITERKQTEQLVQAQLELARLISKVESDQAVWAPCLGIVLQVSGMDSGGIYLFDENQQSLELVHHQGLGQDFIRLVSHYAIETPSTQSVLSGKILYFTTQDLESSTHHRAEKLASIAVVPFYYQGRVLGCFNIASHTLSQVPQFARRALETLAAEIGNIAVYLRTESSLRKSQALLSEAQRIGRIGHWEWTAPTRGLRCSDELFSILGIPKQPFGILLDGITELLNTQDREQMIEWDRVAIANRQNLDYEFRLTMPDGSFRWLHQHALVTYAENGKPVRMIGTIQDITERKQAIKDLAASESRLKNMVDYAMDAIVSSDSDRRIVLFNTAAEKMFGISASQAIGKSLDVFIPQRFRARHQQYMARMKESGMGAYANQGVPIVGIRANGEEFPLEATVSFVENMGEKLYTAILRDVSERRRAEEAVRASEEKYRGLIQSMDSVVATVDEHGRFVYMNDVAAKQLGGTVDQLVGKTMHELFPEPVATNQAEAIQQVFRQGQGLVSEGLSIVLGVPRWYRNSVQPIHDERGQVIQVLVNATDIHALKVAEQKLQDLNHTLEERIKEATAQVQDLYENAPAGYHSLDADGKIVLINQTELTWLGYTRSEVVGRSLADFLTPPSRRVFEENYVLFTRNDGAGDVELEFVRKDGTRFPALEKRTAIYDEQHNYVMSRSTLVDITDRKEAEQALQIANAEMERALRLKDEFLATMSHELRTPLNAILGLSEGLQEQVIGPLNEKQFRALNTIEASGRHLLALINDILDLSKIEAGAIVLNMNSVSIKRLCEASLLFVHESAQKKKITLFPAYDANVEWVVADERRVKQMLVNLLSNAIKFTPEGGQVGLELVGDAEGKAIRLTVWDTGIGIAEHDMARLFKPFIQLDSSLSRRYEGTGLGLSLVARMAEIHGGSVTVTSQVGQGSRFTIMLPWSVEMNIGPRLPDLENKPVPQSLPQAIQPTAASPLVLIAEDNESNVLALSSYLQFHGYRLSFARNGLEALEHARNEHPKVIVMDVQMPVMDGIEATICLRRDHDSLVAQVPIVAVTALAMPGDRERCLTAGANFYLTKPVNLKQLHEIIRQVTDK